MSIAYWSWSRDQFQINLVHFSKLRCHASIGRLVKCLSDLHQKFDPEAALSCNWEISISDICCKISSEMENVLHYTHLRAANNIQVLLFLDHTYISGKSGIIANASGLIITVIQILRSIYPCVLIIHPVAFSIPKDDRPSCLMETVLTQKLLKIWDQSLNSWWRLLI